MRGAVRSFILTVIVLSLTMLPAFGFNYDRYVATDLDALLAQARPGKGVDIYPALPLRLTVTLVWYGEPCDTALLRRSQLMAGVSQQLIDEVKVTRCIQVRSAKGKVLRAFIQDEVSAFLPKEVPIGSKMTLFAIHLFTDTGGPGLLVNDFSTEQDGKPPKPMKDASRNPAAVARASADVVIGREIQ